MYIASLVSLALMFLASPSSAGYREGVPITYYGVGERLPIFAAKLTSTVNHVPYDYKSLKMCHYAAELERVTPQPPRLSLGQLLQGERSHLTGYSLKMGVDEACKQVCSMTYTVEEQREITKLVNDSYMAHLVLDNLPIRTQKLCAFGSCYSYLGVPIGRIGYSDSGKNTCLYNHLRFNVEYHKPDSLKNNRRNIVGFTAQAMTVQHKTVPGNPNELATCPVSPIASPMCFTWNRTQPLSVVWTYDVQYNTSKVAWANRWEDLLQAPDGVREIQWFSLFNSLMVAMFFTAIFARIVRRTLYLNFVRNNNIAGITQEVSGWKAIYGDVFRPPRKSGLFSVLVASGAQILCMSAVTLVLAVAGFLSPANRGALITAMLSSWVLASAVCGYCAARLYASFQGTNTRLVTIGSALFFSGIVFSVFFGLNLVLRVNGSTGAVPFTTLLVLLLIWLGISVPLNVLGAHIGYRHVPYEYPVRTHQIPREVPAKSKFSILFFGVFGSFAVFAVIFVELVFILSSFYDAEFISSFDVLAAVFPLLVVTCAAVSVVHTYQYLYKESYHWWWPSFLITASSAIYVFLYTLSFQYVRNSGGIHIVSALIWTGYSVLFSLSFALATGCIGFFASFAFVWKIYAVLAAHGSSESDRNLVEHHEEPTGDEPQIVGSPSNQGQYGTI